MTAPVVYANRFYLRRQGEIVRVECLDTQDPQGLTRSVVEVILTATNMDELVGLWASLREHQRAPNDLAVN